MWSKRLEVVTNIALLAAAIAVLAFTVIPRARGPQPVAPPYKVGDRIPSTPELQFGKATFILNTASSCRYCTESMPLYRRLVASGARVVAVTPEPIDKNKAYLATHQVVPETVIGVSSNSLKFRATPSLLLVDGGGTVRAAWWGKQDQKGEEEILATKLQ